LAKDEGMQNLNVSGDMEDLLVSKKDLRKISASHSLDVDKENNPNMQSVEAGLDYNKKQQKSTGSNVPFSSQIPNNAADETVDKSADYQGWLDAKKRKWKHAREQRKRRR
jgi:DNA polymerase epsilon subunit 1